MQWDLVFNPTPIEATYMARKKKLTAQEKIAIVQRSPEIGEAVMLLYAAYKDNKLKSFIRYGFKINGEDFELEFKKVSSKIHE